MKKGDVEQVAFRPRDAAKYLGVSRTKFYQLASVDPDFPKKIRFGPRCVCYLRKDLEAYAKRKQLDPYEQLKANC